MTDRPATPLVDDRFLILETLGRGGMAQVYRAFDRLDQRLVALKVQSTAERGGPAHPLSAEFDAWSRLDHPNVVRALSLRRACSGPIPRETPYLVLEHVEGGSLECTLAPGRVPPAMIRGVAVHVLRALEHVHRAGLVHRDLKPSNLLIGDGGRTVKLTDLGLAAECGTREAGTISGSLPYVSPEVLMGLPIDGRADLYSLGLLLSHLVTGKHPVPRSSAREALHWHLAGPPLGLERQGRPLPERLSRFIRRLSARDRDERPSSAAGALRQLGVELASDAPAESAPGRGELATLRLALDAARLGSRRQLRLPTAGSDGLLREARVRSQILGLSCHALAGRESYPGGSLARMVLALLLDRGAEAPRLIERYDLRSAARLEIVGGLPLPDRVGRRPAGSPSSTERDARRVGEFMLDCSDLRTQVVHLERPGSPGTASGALRDWLSRETRGPGSPRPGRGGFLLLL